MRKTNNLHPNQDQSGKENKNNHSLFPLNFGDSPMEVEVPNPPMRHRPSKKVGYCPFILNLLYAENKKKIHKCTVQSIMPFLTLPEIFNIRLLCRIFDETIKEELKFPEYVALNKKWLMDLGRAYGCLNEFSTREGDSLESLFENNSNRPKTKGQIAIELLANNNYMAARRMGGFNEIFFPGQ